MEETTTTEDYFTTSEKYNQFEQADSHVSTWFIVILLTIGSVGLLGNAMTCIVLLRIKKWTSVNILIGIMSLSDLCSIPSVAITMFQSYLAQRFHTTEILTYIRHIFMTASVVSAVVIGCERALAIRDPLKFKEKWTPKLTIKIYIITYSFFMVLVIIRFLISRLVSTEFFGAYLYIPFFAVVRGLPFLLILIANVMVVRGLLMSRRHVTNATSESVEKHRIKTERAVTRTILVLTTVYFVCMVPSRILYGLILSGPIGEDGDLVVSLITILEMTNFSVNIIIYTMTSKFYRKEYVKLLRFCLCGCRDRMRRPETNDINL